MIYRIFFGLILLGMMSGCNINTDLMLRTEKDFKFDEIPEEPGGEYRISPDDVVSFRLFANDGFQLIDITAGQDGGSNNRLNRRNQVQYLVEPDGRVKLPILGRVRIQGMTVREAEMMLEKKYREYYNKPFVLLQVTNKRVIVFPGAGGSAKVITLQNNNMTVMEVLAKAGGISRRGKAKMVKLIRRDEDGERSVHRLNLANIQGMKYGDLVVQADDIIYVEPAPQVARQLVQDVAPIISLLSSAIFVYSTVVGFSN